MIRLSLILMMGSLVGTTVLVGQEQRPGPKPLPGDSLALRGMRIYHGATGCHSCHGRDGRGTADGPNLTDGEWLHGSGATAEISDRVERGVSRREAKTGHPMPMGGWEPLAPSDAAAVAAYVRWLGRLGGRRS
jgi:mono/diheme cytochrome c family protein